MRIDHDSSVIASRRKIARADVHIGYLFTANITAYTANRYRAMLADGEREQCDRFWCDEDRTQFLAGRTLLRSMLSTYFKLPPRACVLALDARGKPEIVHDSAGPVAMFSLSHAQGLVVCAIAIGRDVGVDVERLDSTRPLDDLSRQYFTSAEIAWVYRTPRGQLGRFFDIWTLKEAYIKARGDGLGIPLTNFTFVLPHENRRGIQFRPPADDIPTNWQFATYRLGPQYRLAVAARVEAERLVCFSVRSAGAFGAAMKSPASARMYYHTFRFTSFNNSVTSAP